MSSVKVKHLPIGTIFEWKGIVWRRVKTKMKNCCVCDYTAENIVTGEKGYVPLDKKVSPIEGDINTEINTEIILETNTEEKDKGESNEGS